MVMKYDKFIRKTVIFVKIIFYFLLLVLTLYFVLRLFFSSLSTTIFSGNPTASFLIFNAPDQNYLTGKLRPELRPFDLDTAPQASGAVTTATASGAKYLSLY